MEKENFYKKSFILSSSNILTGILGFTFSIILSKELGAEALGLYGLLMPIYNLFICLMCGGILTSISRLTAIYFDNKYFNKVNLTIKTSMIFTLIWSLIIAIIVYTLAPIIAQIIIKDTRIITAIKIITSTTPTIVAAFVDLVPSLFRTKRLVRCSKLLLCCTCCCNDWRTSSNRPYL